MEYMSPPGYQSIYSPCIPFITPINGGLRPGMCFYIQGRIHHGISRFHVNLQCGEYSGSDVALHFNPRFDLWDKVVFNTFRNGSWEGEEKIHFMPFHRGHHFELVIVVSMEGYQISVNGKQLYMYQHRMPVGMVGFLEVGGDVVIENINIIGGMQGMGGMMGYPGGMAGGMGVGYPGGQMGGYYSDGGMMGGYPSGGMGGMGGVFPGPGMAAGGMGYPGAGLPMMGLQPIFNPCVPYSELIPGGMTFNRTIIIRGMVPYGAYRFCINFVDGNSRDIAFQLDARVSEGYLLTNSSTSGCWGAEERHECYNPFMEGQFFELCIRCGEDKFKVYANGQHLCTFHHRLHYSQITMLEVEGDVQLSYIHY